MRLTFSGELQIFPDFGPAYLISGDVIDVEDELAPRFLQRGDFEESPDATLSDLTDRLPKHLQVAEAVEPEREEEFEPATETEPEEPEVVEDAALAADHAIEGDAASAA